MQIREFERTDLKAIKDIVQSLHPDWFDKNALRNIPVDVQFQKTLIAEDKGNVIGFVSYFTKDGEATIGWIGLNKEKRGKKYGTQLIERMEMDLTDKGVSIVRVETVGETTPLYKPYEETVKFYKKLGFEVDKKSEEKEEQGFKFRMYTFKKALSH